MPRILIVDDDTSVRKVVRLMLEQAGFEVIEAGDGPEGIRAYRRQPPDLVFCDMFMPEQDGLEVIRQLRREFPEAKIIAMSGNTFAGRMDMLPLARLLGAAGVLDKPFTQATVVAAVRRILPIHDGNEPSPSNPPALGETDSSAQQVLRR
jgi:CheY-like chemotaxis protein